MHKEGKLAEAEKLYDKILKHNPASGDALNLKGVIATTRGLHAAALKLLDRAVALMPSYPDAHFTWGASTTRLGNANRPWRRSAPRPGSPPTIRAATTISESACKNRCRAPTPLHAKS